MIPLNDEYDVPIAKASAMAIMMRCWMSVQRNGIEIYLRLFGMVIVRESQKK